MNEIRQFPNVAEVRQKARRDWEKEFKRKLSIQERIGNSVSWWLVLVALVFFLLSVPHTMTIFGMITPVVGFVAPLGIEFGLLYVAFSRKRAERPTRFLWTFFILLFVTSIVANGAGSLFAVLDTIEELERLSLSGLFDAFETMPAQNQVALFLVPVAALIIPIGTVVAGEGLAALFLERQETGSQMETDWIEVRARVEFEALRDAAVQMGVTPLRAARWAEGLVITLPDSVPAVEVSGVSALSGASAPPSDDMDTAHPQRTAAADTGSVFGHGTGQGYTKRMDARQVATEYLSANPYAANMTARQLAEAAGIGKSTAAQVLGEWASNGHRNGHSDNGADSARNEGE